MNSIRDSGHFIPLDDVPRLDESTSVGEVFSYLARTRRGGIIVLKHGRPSAYITAQLLKDILSRVSTVGWDSIMKTSVQDLWPRLGADSLPFERQTFDQTDNVTQVGPSPDAFFAIEHSGNQTGWFFTKEIWSDTVYTPPPEWECDRPEKHITRDPNSGKCWCGGRLSPR